MIDIENKTDFEQFIAQDSLTLVDFTAAWCGPCRALAPMLDQISEKLPIAKVDIDKHAELAAQMGVKSIPNLILFKSGQEIDRNIGLPSSAKLNEFVDRHEK